MPPKTDRRPIRVYKLQCDVEKEDKEIELGAHLIRIVKRKALRRVAHVISSVSPSIVTLISVISNWQYISLSAN